MWELTQAWYGDRLSAGYAPKPIEHLQGLLDAAGLSTPFWRLTPTPGVDESVC